jgi:hypothetical protein
MKLEKDELTHLLFLADVVKDGNKKKLMPDMLECLLYVARSVTEADLPDNVILRIRQLTGKMEEELRQENDRLKEIRHNLRR